MACERSHILNLLAQDIAAGPDGIRGFCLPDQENELGSATPLQASHVTLRPALTDKGCGASSNGQAALARGIGPVIPCRSIAPGEPGHFPKILCAARARIARNCNPKTDREVGTRRFQQLLPVRIWTIRCETVGHLLPPNPESPYRKRSLRSRRQSTYSERLFENGL